MIRLLLIFVLLTQMGCSVIQTTAGTFIGTLSADITKEVIDKANEVIDKTKEVVGKEELTEENSGDE